MYESIDEALKNGFYDNPGIASRLPEFEAEVLEGRKDSFEAAEELLDIYRKSDKEF